jgi:glycosyltransferase involved in cell wall biosynthesis
MPGETVRAGRPSLLRFLLARKGESWPVLAAQLVRSLRAEGPRATWRRLRTFVGAVSDAAATPVPPRDTRKLCLFVAGCPGHPRRYRCEHAAEALARRGYTADVVDYPAVPFERVLDCYRAFVLQRVPFDRAVGRFVDAARRLGKPVVFDTDDLVVGARHADETGLFDPANASARRLYSRYFERLEQTFERCDAAWVSTDELAAALRELRPGVPVRVVRNAASQRMVERSAAARSAPHDQRDEVVLGYFSGTRTHRHDLAVVVPALATVLAERPRAVVLLAGEIDVPDALARFGPRVRRMAPVPWPELPALLRAADVHLVPLPAGNAFAAAKSELKFFEAGLVARPTVAAAVGPFRACIDSGANGYTCGSVAEWVAVLLRLVDDRAHREALGQASLRVALARYTTAARADELSAALGAALGRPGGAPTVAIAADVPDEAAAALRGLPVERVPRGASSPDADVLLCGTRAATPHRARRVLAVASAGAPADVSAGGLASVPVADLREHVLASLR